MTIQDQTGDAPKSLDILSLHTQDGEHPTIKLSARGLPTSGKYVVAFAEWDENWYELTVTKTRDGLRSNLVNINPETGERRAFTCDYSVHWKQAKHIIKVGFVRDSCFYEHPGDKYTGFAPQWATLASQAGKDKIVRQF